MENTITYLLLCSTTVGMGLLFTWQYRTLLFALVFFACFLGFVFMITIFLAKLARRLYRKEELPKWAMQLLFIIVILLTSAILQWILPYIKQ